MLRNDIFNKEKMIIQEVKMYYNALTKKNYEGKNVEILKSTGLIGGFMTFNQAYKLGYKIPKGTKAIAKLNKPFMETNSYKNIL